jgi:hypothetical protein
MELMDKRELIERPCPHCGASAFGIDHNDQPPYWEGEWRTCLNCEGGYLVEVKDESLRPDKDQTAA